MTTEYEKIDSPGINASTTRKAMKSIYHGHIPGNGNTQFEVKMSVDGGAQSVLKIEGYEFNDS
ncbi:hypothetical protein KEH51_22905 [[Brevibacterium] frigoritolerans]|uniref:Uncharacterized protein n=1 Tax=Peribacillus frigoritolerans TaxID=450367 RepID=A0A941FQJ2_9BACI|nr:hypothetical protein [Peribacillus frigoritolerans]